MKRSILVGSKLSPQPLILRRQQVILLMCNDELVVCHLQVLREHRDGVLQAGHVHKLVVLLGQAIAVSAPWARRHVVVRAGRARHAAVQQGCDARTAR